MAETQTAEDMLEQWLKGTISWMRAQHGLKTFQFETDNVEFAIRKCQDLLVEKGGTVFTNAPCFPETISIIERSWSTIGEMTSMMLIQYGVAESLESFWQSPTPTPTPPTTTVNSQKGRHKKYI